MKGKLQHQPIRRVIVLGNIASGKSYLTKHISHELKLPEYHLDKLYWRADWSHINHDEFIQKQDEIVTKDAWVIDGCFSEFGLETRFAAADVVFFLDMPPWFCLKNALARRGNKRNDLPDGADDADIPIVRGLSIILDLLTFRLRVPRKIAYLSTRYQGKLTVIKSWDEEDEILRAIAYN